MKRMYNSTSVRGIIRRGDEVLVEWLAHKGIAFLPGGTIEGEEGLMEALSRELAEEIQGAICSIGVYRGTIGHRWRTGMHYDSCLNHFYEVELLSAATVSAKEPGRCLQWIQLGGKDAERLQPPRLRSLLTEPHGELWSYQDCSE